MVFVRLLVLELIINVPLVGAWASNGLADPVVLCGFHAARIGLVWAVLWSMLEPLRRWRSAASPTDEVVLAADACLQRLFARFMWVYIPAMALTSGLALLLQIRNAGPTEALSPSDILFGVLFVLVAMGLNSTVIFARMRGVMDFYMASLGPELASRGLSPARTRRSSRQELILISGVLAFTTLTAGGASGFSYDARGKQANTKLELRNRLGRAADELREQGAIEVEGVELRTTAELPSTLVPTGERHEFLVVYEGREDRVVAALELGEGRWAVAEARPPGNLLLGFFNLVAFEVIVVLLVSSTFAWLSRALFEPLARLDEASRSLSTRGELGALARAHPVRDDELGSLVRNYNGMLDMLQELVAVANAVARGELSVEPQHPGDLHDAFRIMLVQLREMVDSLRSVALEVTSASSEIHARMQAQAEAATEHAEAVEASSQTIFDLADAARQISSKSGQVRDQAEANLDTIDTVVDRIASLDEEAAGIAVLLDQIREIASRSDLLALNGSLEATRAGEAGRGFALVAAEMRRLAERVTGVVADVETRVRAIESASAATVSAAQRSRLLARSSAEFARDISSLTAEQREGSEQASAAAQRTASFVRDSATSVRQTSDAADGLRQLVAELERLTKAFS